MNVQQAWEYRVETIGSGWKSTSDEEMAAILNQWGEAGWEIISVRPPTNSNKITVVAKRPLTEDARRRRKRSQPEW
jgi:hypothetical protein